MKALRARPPVVDREHDIESMSLAEGFKDLFKGERQLKEWNFLMGILRFETSISMPFITL